MRISDWSSDVCSSDLGDLLQLGKAVDPEEFVKIEIAVLALRRVGVGRQDIEADRLAALAQVEHDRIARQVDAGYLLDTCGDIAADAQRLALRRRQEDLVARFPVEDALPVLHHPFPVEKTPGHPHNG